MRDMRDMWDMWDMYAGYAGYVCGICGICGTDHLPEIGPWGLPFFWTAPQSTKGGKKERQTPANQKGMFIFHLNC